MTNSDRTTHGRNDQSWWSAGVSHSMVLGCAGVLILLSSADTRLAQAWDSRGVRDAAQRILSSRPYRNLKPIERKRGPRRFRGSGQSGSGSGSGSGRQGRGGAENEKGGEGQEGEAGRFDGNRGEFGNGSGDAADPDSGNSTGPDTAESADTPQMSGSVGVFLGSIFQLLGWLFIAVIACAMVYLIVKGIVGAFAWYQNRDPSQPQTDDGPAPVGELTLDTAPGELPADVYVGRARKLAAAGRFRDAVAQLLLGAMSHIERAGLIRFRKGLTYRDYERAIRNEDASYQSMRAMVRVYEPLGFGRRKATPQHFEQSLSGYQAGFRATHSPQKT